MARPNSTSTSLRQFVGTICEISTKNKAVVQFQLNGQNERALLWYDRLRRNGEPLTEPKAIADYVKIDAPVKFLCHEFDASGVDRCGWFITIAWLQEDKYKFMTTSCDQLLDGMYNFQGTISEISNRQGVISFRNWNTGQEENALFLGSKLWLSGKRVSAKVVLSTLPDLEEGRTLYFDAVPCDPLDCDGKYSWFAMVVWKGRKPRMDYDSPNYSAQTPLLPNLTAIKLLTSNPHSQFLRTQGEIMKILNPEFGLALASLKSNRWETVLFHRSHAMLFDESLASTDLSEIFIEGDKIRIVAAAAPKTMGVSWVASQIRPYMDPSITHKYQF